MADITPVTREEFYLAKAGGQDVPVPSAVTREEYYLEKLSNDDVAVPSPVTRREKFLYFACGGEIDLPSEERMTRLERLIAKAGGMDVSTPTAVTRLEKFWANVEGGGWKTITGVLPLTFTAKAGNALDWVIYGNDENGTENLFDTSTVVDGYISGSTGELSSASAIAKEKTSDYIPVEANAVYTFSCVGGFPSTSVAAWRSFAWYDTAKNFILRGANTGSEDYVTTSPPDAAFVRVSYRSFGVENLQLMLVKGSTAPDHYIPYQQGVGENTEITGELPIDFRSNGDDLLGYKIYGTADEAGVQTESGEPAGYKIPLTVTSGTESKTVDIYIGDSKLGEEEYVDYGEQKIYKRILFMTYDDKHFITKDNKDFCLRRRGYSG